MMPPSTTTRPWHRARGRRAPAAAVALAAALLLGGCGSFQGKPGPGNAPTYDNGVLGNGRGVEENRKVGSPGSD